jgi:hypothetical protein
VKGETPEQTSKRKPPGKRRRFHPPLLGSLGYWSVPVQKVVKRWREQIGGNVFDQVIESYMIAGVYSVTRAFP